jgi:3,4-dihydroxy-2-butanone 4-phosphate synthase
VVAAYAHGKMVLVVDGEREHEGDVAILASEVSAAAITFMATYARGIVCVPMLGERLDALKLPLMVANRGDLDTAAFTVSVDARDGVTTGVSAEDRARTIRTLIHPATRPTDLIRPGHVFPLRYAEGGLLTRRGHTEAVVDMAKIANCYPAAVICEVMNDDGTMAREDDLMGFAKRHHLPVISIAELAEYRRRTDHAMHEHAPSSAVAEGPDAGPTVADGTDGKRAPAKRDMASNGIGED